MTLLFQSVFAITTMSLGHSVWGSAWPILARRRASTPSQVGRRRPNRRKPDVGDGQTRTKNTPLSSCSLQIPTRNPNPFVYQIHLTHLFQLQKFRGFSPH
ncbi:hypothetical protein Hanom_Chr03g00235251 [Helianthus anomalus]